MNFLVLQTKVRICIRWPFCLNMFLRLFTINISFGNIKTRFSVLEHQRPAEKCSVDSMLNLYSEKSCLLRKIVSFLDNLQQLNIGSDKNYRHSYWSKPKLRIPFRIFIIGNLIREIKAEIPRCFLWVSELIKLLKTAWFAAAFFFLCCVEICDLPENFSMKFSRWAVLAVTNLRLL